MSKARCGMPLNMLRSDIFRLILLRLKTRHFLIIIDGPVIGNAV